MIEIKNLSKAFKNHIVLEDLNLKINTGESMVIIGRSGCGKSVLLKHIIGLLKPESGSITIGSTDITGIRSSEMNKIRMDFGMLFQGAALFDSLTVLENVGFRLYEYTDLLDDEIRVRVKECLKMVGLENVEDMKPSELSGGMKKRVGLARAISMFPKVILFDEPTTGLDPIMADTINQLIRYLHNKLKTTSITVTHDMKSAYEIADRIAMLYDKKIIALGSPEEIKRSDNEIVRQFIAGSSKGPIV